MNDLYDLFSVVVGSLIGGYILYAVFAFPIFWIKRRYFYDKDARAADNLHRIQSEAFYEYVRSKAEIDMTYTRLKEVFEWVYATHKNKAPDFRNSRYNHYKVYRRNGGAKLLLANSISEQFPFLSLKQALKLLRLEDRYLRSFLPLWKKFLGL